ncbi:hypothetical protein DPEC_G00207420 [Dallia pectoralis]|uniref:Uncharacterized protein n=1 Tax=Dallia pectoralis TaxID=75939 RepID=A0ACC2G514_DALPE|nr:hypothetical protein DPEC_G00207420 [Dallia pectoralis]
MCLSFRVQKKVPINLKRVHILDPGPDNQTSTNACNIVKETRKSKTACLVWRLEIRVFRYPEARHTLPFQTSCLLQNVLEKRSLGRPWL